MPRASVVATTYPGTWEDAYRTVVAPMLKKKDDIDLELAPLFAMDQIGKAKAARGAPPFDVFVLDPGPRIVGLEGGLFEKFDAKKLSNLAKLPAGFTDDVGVHVSAQVVGIAYNPKKVPAPKGWADLLKDPWVSRLGITGFQTTFGTSSLIETQQAVRRLADQRRSGPGRAEEGAAQDRRGRPAGRDAGPVPARPVRRDVHQHPDGRDAQGQGRRRGVREAGERRHHLLHDHAHRQGHRRPRRTPTSISTS